jgi:hypothetical protein
MTESIETALRRFKIQHLKAMLVANQMECKVLERQYETEGLSEQERTAIVNRWNAVAQDASAARLELERLEKQAKNREIPTFCLDSSQHRAPTPEAPTGLFSAYRWESVRFKNTDAFVFSSSGACHGGCFSTYSLWNGRIERIRPLILWELGRAFFEAFWDGQKTAVDVIDDASLLLDCLVERLVGGAGFPELIAEILIGLFEALAMPCVVAAGFADEEAEGGG